MMQQYKKELEQEPFDPEEFVERLAWRTISEVKKDGDDEFNPVILHESFVQAIKDLTLLGERQQKTCERLETAVREEELTFSQEIQRLQERNREAVETFQQLDGKINSVATKVIHLGDQLDNVNGPRTRVVEAQRLMTYLSDFLTTGPLTSTVFTDPTKIYEAADIIQKLYLIAQDLPSPKFDGAKTKIKQKYDKTEMSLIEEFAKAQRFQNIERMKEIAKVLSQFKGYSQCVDAFIEQSQERALSNKDVFPGLVSLCERNYDIIKQVFNNPEQVMAKFVLNIYQLKLQMYIAGKLSERTDSAKYLKNLHEVYSKTLQLSSDLSVFDMGSDKNFLKKLVNNIFAKYLDYYISVELKCMREMSATTLQKYYESKNHQKKQIQTGGFQDLRRDLQAVIGTRANINIAQIENYGGETFLSEELAITLLQEIKQAFQRCQLLSKKDDVANNATQLLDCLLNSLVIEHLDYALELGLQAVPIAEGKSPPQIYFFDVVRQCNAIIHLLEKLFADSVVPLVLQTQRYNDCLQKKKFVLDQIEMKINTGLDRSLNAIVTWVKIYLQAEQRKTDFRPETDDITTLSSPACRVVVQYINSSIIQIQQSLDGNNVTAILQELGIRLHKVIYDHLLQFQYNTAGAMVAICDLNEYRRCTEPLGSLVANLFDVLHSLCNLLLVKPENLQQVCSGEQLAELDRSVLSNFIQLRSDFKTQKLTLLKV